MEIGRVIEIATGIWQEDLRQRQIAFATKGRQINEVAAARGLGASGTHIGAFFEACSSEIHIRARLARNVLRKVVHESGSKPSENELLTAYRSLITNMYQDIDSKWKTILGIVPRSRESYNAEMRRLGDEEVRAITQQLAEVRLVVEALQQSRPATVSVQGNVGAIQTGPHASAHVAMTIDSQASQGLSTALAAFLEETAKRTDIPSSVVAISTDIQAELNVPTRSGAHVERLVAALGGIVSGIADLPPAWNAVKSAAALMGLHLP